MSGYVEQIVDENGDNIYPVSAVSGSSYCKMADGTLICWGQLNTNNKDINGRSLSIYNREPNTKYQYLSSSDSVLKYTPLIFAEDKASPLESWMPRMRPIIFAVPFVEVPQVSISAGAGTDGWFTKIKWDATEIIQMNYVTDKKSSPAEVGNIHWVAVGRWK